MTDTHDRPEEADTVTALADWCTDFTARLRRADALSRAIATVGDTDASYYTVIAYADYIDHGIEPVEPDEDDVEPGVDEAVEKKDRRPSRVQQATALRQAGEMLFEAKPDDLLRVHGATSPVSRADRATVRAWLYALSYRVECGQVTM